MIVDKSKIFNKIIHPSYQEDLDIFSDYIVINWGELSCRKGLTEDFIRKYKDKLNWRLICSEQVLSESFIEEHIKLIDWYLISRHQKLPEAFIEKHSKKLDWVFISQYQELSDSFLEKYKRKIHWLSILCSNRKLSEDSLRNFLNKKTKINCAYYTLCEHIFMFQKLSDSFVLEISDINNKAFQRCFRSNISQYKKLSSDLLLKLEGKKLVDWSIASEYQNLPEDLIEKHIKEINWYYISLKQKLSIDFIFKFEDKIDFDQLSRNKNLSAEIIKKYYQRLNVKYLLKNKKLPQDIKDIIKMFQ